jgi:hypothetical protein
LPISRFFWAPRDQLAAPLYTPPQVGKHKSGLRAFCGGGPEKPCFSQKKNLINFDFKFGFKSTILVQNAIKLTSTKIGASFIYWEPLETLAARFMQIHNSVFEDLRLSTLGL